MLIIDIKTGKPADWHKYQLIAYYQLAKENDTDIEFVEEGHKYFKDRIEVPSVTQILQLVQNWNYKGGSEATERGTYVHKCCELDNKGMLGFDSLGSEAQNYVRQWRKFREEKLSKNIVMEQKFYSNKLFMGYAGTVDCIDYDHKEDDLWLVYLQPHKFKPVRIRCTEQLFRDFLCILRTFYIRNGG
jgi:hypothetical protein